MNPSEGPKRTVVRLYPDYADTVLWFNGPVDYDLAGLTDGLVEELRAWELSYYASLTRNLPWKSAALAARFTEEGNRLAQRVADELGDGYEIEFRSYEENARSHRFRGIGGPNASAVAAFDALTAVSRAEHGRISRALAERPPGEGTGWFATSPISGSIFKPPGAAQE